MLYTSRTILIHTKCGVIKVTPQGKRRFGVSAPKHIKLTDRHGKPLTRKASGG